MKTHLVSIIIPAFNRAHLIRETLDSVIIQTHQNWECIIVDDGSTDDTLNVLKEYAEKDKRFAYYQRGNDRLKGANACRNIGLDKAVGDYVILFDSDDLMTENHIEAKLKPLKNGEYDYSIAKTKFFNVDDDRLERYYRFDQYKLSAHNYIVQNINWLTYDACIKKNLAKSVRFNEKLQSGQEYNYFSKMVLKSINGVFIEEYLTLRRQHEGSIRSGLDNKSKKVKGGFTAVYLTYLEVKEELSKITKTQILKKCIRSIYNEKSMFGFSLRKFSNEIFLTMGFKSYINFVLMYALRMRFGRGYNFYQRLKS